MFDVYPWSGVRRPQFQTSPPKPLGQLKLNFIWSLLGKRERKFVCGIWVTRPRWPPFPCMVKTLQDSSSPEPVNLRLYRWGLQSILVRFACSVLKMCYEQVGRFRRNSVWCIVDSGLFYFVQMINLD